MAGGEALRADPVGERDHRVDPQLAVADHARVRGAPGAVAVDEPADHGGPELRLEVERQVRDPERMGELAGANDRQRRAAALRRVGAAIGPQLQGHGDHLRPALALAQRRHRGVDAPADRDQDALAARRRGGELDRRTRRLAERPMQGIGGELDRVAPLRADPAERPGDGIRADQRGVEHPRPVDELGDRRGRGACRGTALGVDGHRVHRPALDRDRDPDQVATGGAAGGPVEAAGKRLAAVARIVQVSVERLSIHADRG